MEPFHVVTVVFQSLIDVPLTIYKLIMKFWELNISVTVNWHFKPCFTYLNLGCNHWAVGHVYPAMPTAG